MLACHQVMSSHITNEPFLSVLASWFKLLQNFFFFNLEIIQIFLCSLLLQLLQYYIITKTCLSTEESIEI